SKRIYREIWPERPVSCPNRLRRATRRVPPTIKQLQHRHLEKIRATGFEPAASATQTRRSTKLSYALPCTGRKCIGLTRPATRAPRLALLIARRIGFVCCGVAHPIVSGRRRDSSPGGAIDH